MQLAHDGEGGPGVGFTTGLWETVTKRAAEDCQNPPVQHTGCAGAIEMRGNITERQMEHSDGRTEY